MDDAPEGWLDPARREAFRARCVAEIPAGYSPWAHLAIPSLTGLGVAAACVASLKGVRAVELLAVPAMYLLSNATEWRAHKDLLHRRRWPFQVLYDRHTPTHHRIYHTEDMAVRSRREWRLVLLPAYGVALIALGTFPLALGLSRWVGTNVAALTLATGMLYVVSYEWLHLAYHLPQEHPVARLGWIRALRAHHARHHDPRLMQRWNFNVTVPLWDLVRGTVWRAPTEGA